MSNVLVLVEQRNGSPKKQGYNSISFGHAAAKLSGSELHLLVVGPEARMAAESLNQFGAAKIHVVDKEGVAHYLSDSYAQVVTEVAKSIDAKIIAAGSTSTSKDCFPRVAVKLDAAMASDVKKIHSVNEFDRDMWAGSVTATVRLTTDVKVVTVLTTEFDPPEEVSDPTPIEDFAISIAPSAVEFIELKEVESTRPDAAVADVVVSGGRGIKGPEGFKLIEQLADALGGGVGASRAICDAGWVPNDLQIGQTGKVVAPNLYIAAGISGAMQHLAGMKGSKVIVAINTDPEAPVFQAADYGLVADLFEAIPELISTLKA